MVLLQIFDTATHMVGIEVFQLLPDRKKMAVAFFASKPARLGRFGKHLQILEGKIPWMFKHGLLIERSRR